MDKPSVDGEEVKKILTKNERIKMIERAIKTVREKVGEFMETVYCCNTKMMLDQENYQFIILLR